MSGYVNFPPIAIDTKALHLTGEIEERPEEYGGPNLAPTGIRVVALELGEASSRSWPSPCRATTSA